MNLKLDVVKLVNDDVISTSGVDCKKHPNTAHFYSVDIHEDQYNKYVVGNGYDEGEITAYGTDRDLDDFSPEFNVATDLNKWYYFDGSHYVECDGDHSNYTKLVR